MRSHPGHDTHVRSHGKGEISRESSAISHCEIQDRNPVIVYYDDDIMRLSDEAITRELPQNVPFVVKKQLISETIDLWSLPIEFLVSDVKKIFVSHMRLIIDAKFGQHEHGGLHSAVSNLVTERITRLLEKTTTTIQFLYELERVQTFTLNDHYLSDYKEKFKTYYSAIRQENKGGKESSFLSGLMKGMNSTYHGSRNASSRTPFAENLCTVISKLAEMGVSVSPLDLAKLLETDTSIESLDVMAEVRAYYQVCYKRFTDVVCMTIDQALVRAFAANIDMDLCKALGTSSDDAKKQCASLLANSAEVMLTRESLTTRCDRLEAAKNEIALLWNA